MNKLLSVALVGLLILSPGWATANTGHGPPDIGSIFSEDEKPLQISMLSPEEMLNTQGELLPFTAVGGAAIGGLGYFLTTDTPNWEGFIVSAGTGAFYVYGFSGAIIGMLGQAYANEIIDCSPPFC